MQIAALRDLLSDRMSFIRAMEKFHLSDGLKRLDDLTVLDAHDSLASVHLGTVLLCLVAACVLAALYCFGFKQFVHRADRDLKRTRGLVLLFPEETINQSVEVRNLVKAVRALPTRCMLSGALTAPAWSVRSSSRRSGDVAEAG